MKQIKVSDADGRVLDWLVAKCEGNSFAGDYPHLLASGFRPPRYSTDWSQGGPIMDRELIDTYYDIHWKYDPADPEDNGERWFASPAGDSDMVGVYGATRLIAGMRLHVIRKLGETAEIPEELQ